jgi:hypothetical protein
VIRGRRERAGQGRVLEKRNLDSGNKEKSISYFYIIYIDIIL